jgi:hypothetical protein
MVLPGRDNGTAYDARASRISIPQTTDLGLATAADKGLVHQHLAKCADNLFQNAPERRAAAASRQRSPENPPIWNGSHHHPPGPRRGPDSRDPACNLREMPCSFPFRQGISAASGSTPIYPGKRSGLLSVWPARLALRGRDQFGEWITHERPRFGD